MAGRLIVKAKTGAAMSAIKSRAQALGGSHAQSGAKAATESHLTDMGLGAMQVDASKQDAVMNDLASRSDVEFVAPVYEYRLAFTPNDPKYSSQYHHPLMGAPSAWNTTTGVSSIKIAILDTGCDASHPDLSPLLQAGYNFYDNNTDTADVHGHGTATAGTAAARGNNGIGVTGVTMACPIVPVRISSPTGSAYSDDIAAGMKWAADVGCKVINCSFGPLQGDSVIESAAGYARSKGALVFVSSGNDGTRESAGTVNMIFVGATDSSDRKTSFSTYGPSLRLAAPGSSVLSTTRGGSYSYWSGTSFSSPLAAGAAALVWSANPALSNTQVESILYSTAKDLGTAGWDELYGYGRVDVDRAVSAATGGQRVVESAGNASLLVDSSGAYFVRAGTTTTPFTVNGGAVTNASQSGYAPVAAESNSAGFVIAWLTTDKTLSMVWQMDAQGRFSSATNALTGIQAAEFETLVQYDLNSDGTLGPTATLTVEAAGSASLVVDLTAKYSIRAANVAIRFGGAALGPSSYVGWNVLGVEPKNGGYIAAWLNARAGQFTVWTLDGQGNCTSLGDMVGAAQIVSREAEFQQDLNADGVIGLQTASTVETNGSASLLVDTTNAYVVRSSTTSARVTFNSSPVGPSTYAGWAAIATETASSGFILCWKYAATNSYFVWTLDSQGRETGLSAQMSSSQIAGRELEFQQDLNGDGTIGAQTASTVESVGTASLLVDTAGLYVVRAGSASVPVRYAGQAVGPSTYTGWAALGAETSGGGYLVSWKNAAMKQYTVWTLDAQGNTTAISAIVGPSEIALREATFQQDLNGDGSIGAMAADVIEQNGATTLGVDSNNHHYEIRTGSAVLTLTLDGNMIGPMTYASGGWAAIGVEAKGSGYQLVWQSGTNYTVWDLDATGATLKLSSVLTPAQIGTYETGLQQDLNGNGVLGN